MKIESSENKFFSDSETSKKSEQEDQLECSIDPVAISNKSDIVSNLPNTPNQIDMQHTTMSQDMVEQEPHIGNENTSCSEDELSVTIEDSVDAEISGLIGIENSKCDWQSLPKLESYCPTLYYKEAFPYNH